MKRKLEIQKLEAIIITVMIKFHPQLHSDLKIVLGRGRPEAEKWSEAEFKPLPLNGI